jgi:hypothetical protein
MSLKKDAGRGKRVLEAICQFFFASVRFGPLLLLVAIIYAKSALKALLIPTDHIDGTYQTFAALTRIAQQEVFGRDFQSYLGIGPTMSLLPIWFLKGQTVSGAVFSAYFLLSLIVVSQIFLILKWVSSLTLSHLPLWTLGFFTLLSSTSEYRFPFFSPLFNLDIFDYVITPGASLRTLRNSLPWVLACVLALIYKRINNLKIIVLVGGSVAGCSTALWSNDVGLPAGGLFIMFIFLYLYSSKNFSIKQLLHMAISSILIGVFFYLLSISLASASNPVEIFRYNFSDVRGDQSWYFAPWSRSGKVLNLVDYFFVLWDEWVIIPVLILGIRTISAIRRREINGLCTVYVGWSLVCSASVATIFGHRDNYFIAFRFWALLVVLALISTRLNSKITSFKHRANPQIFLVLSMILVFSCISNLLTSIDELNNKRSSLSASQSYFRSDKLGGYLPRSYLKAVTFRPLTGETVVEEYTGILKSSIDYPYLMRVDSIIHALGKERQRAEAVIGASPDFIVSTNPEMLRNGVKSGSWLSWNISANWWFYRHLFKSYEFEWFTPNTILWRRSSSLYWPLTECQTGPKFKSFALPENSVGFYEVSLVFSSKPNNGTGPIRVKNAINYGDNSGGGFLTLDPDETSFLFPVFISERSNAERSFVIDSLLSDDHLPKIQNCFARKILFNNSSNAFVDYVEQFQRG